MVTGIQPARNVFQRSIVCINNLVADMHGFDVKYANNLKYSNL
jgi:hypothetical protein